PYFLLLLFHIFFKRRHDFLDLVRIELWFTCDGVFYASSEHIGNDIHLLTAQVESNLKANAVADFVFLVLELCRFILPKQRQHKEGCAENDDKLVHKECLSRGCS